MKKLTLRSISLLLALVLIVGMIPTASAYTADPWAQEEVGEMSDLGLLPDSLAAGDLTQNITRLDMCRIAVLAYEELTGREIPVPVEHPFPDTTDPAVEKAQWVGLVKGSTDGLFHPDNNLTRIDFFAFVGQFLETIGYPVTDSDYGDLTMFSDCDTLPQWAADYTRLTVGIGVVKGTSESTPTLSWSSTATAQQAICMFCRAYSAASEQALDPPEIAPVSVAYENLSEWAEESVMVMDELGLVPTSVKYSPMRGPVSRLDMCRVVMNTYKNLWGITDADLGPVEESPFTDTDDVDVVNAYRMEIISGDGDGCFRPNDPITRQEFFKITQNFLEAIGYLHSDDDMISLEDYIDGEEFASYAEAPTRVLIALGIVNGSSEIETDANGNHVTVIRLNPTDEIVCEQALAIFYRAHNFALTWKPSEGNGDSDDPGDETDPNEPSTEDQPTDEELTQIQKVIKLALEIEANDDYWYVWGGNDPSDGGFDCSGFVFYVYKAAGVRSDLYQPCSNQWNVLGGWDTVIPRDELRPGDLLFFWDDSRTGFQHVGMYIGNGKMVHASNSRVGIIISSIDEPYYLGRYMGAQRVVK